MRQTESCSSEDILFPPGVKGVNKRVKSEDDNVSWESMNGEISMVKNQGS